MHLTPHVYKNVTLQANAQKIITWKCMWHHICAKPLLWRQMLRKSSLKMHLTPNMYKIVTERQMFRQMLSTKLLLWRQMHCYLTCQICTKSSLCWANDFFPSCESCTMQMHVALINVIKFYIIVLFCKTFTVKANAKGTSLH